MQATDITGTYTYRSFLDRPEPVDDFNDLRFAQLELRLTATAAGQVGGLLVFPASVGEEPLMMEMVGQADGTPLTITLTGKGVPGTPIEDFHYEYDGVALRHWPTGVGQRMTLAGTVLRAADHGSGANLAKAGQTASFLAVKRDT